MSPLHIGEKICIKESVFIFGLTNWDICLRNRFSSNRYLDDFIRLISVVCFVLAINQFSLGSGVILFYFQRGGGI